MNDEDEEIPDDVDNVKEYLKRQAQKDRRAGRPPRSPEEIRRTIDRLSDKVTLRRISDGFELTVRDGDTRTTHVLNEDDIEILADKTWEVEDLDVEDVTRRLASCLGDEGFHTIQYERDLGDCVVRVEYEEKP